MSKVGTCKPLSQLQRGYTLITDSTELAHMTACFAQDINEHVEGFTLSDISGILLGDELLGEKIWVTNYMRPFQLDSIYTRVI